MKTKAFFLSIFMLIISFSAFAEVECTQENYDKIKAGMTYEEATDILGKAQECNSAIGITNCRWGSDEKYIQIQFVADKVVLFSGKGLS